MFAEQAHESSQDAGTALDGGRLDRVTRGQLLPELAALKPQYLYVPLTLMTEKLDLLRPFAEQGTIPVAVLPRVIADNEAAATGRKRAFRLSGDRLRGREQVFAVPHGARRVGDPVRKP